MSFFQLMQDQLIKKVPKPAAAEENITADMAKNLLKAAVLADSSGELGDALVLYKQALDKWFILLSEESDLEEQNNIKELITVYMTRAEEIKATLNSVPTTQQKAGVKMSGAKRASAAPSVPSDLTNYHTGRKPQVPTRNPARGKSAVAAPPNARSDEYESQIASEMLDTTPGVRWSDIAGLEYAKQTIQEAVILPNMRPDLFQGLRSPPKGLLLYGPPGTGKTMIAKAIATESGFSFYSISASSVTSKFIGEGEKLMRAVFSVARKTQPSVVFFDEIDALLSARKENEHEASRRMKTEFMVQVDGAGTNSGDRLLIVGATNTPWDLDEAVIRRFTKRIYIPLPEPATRAALITHLMQKQQQQGGKPVPARVIQRVVHMTEGYSGSDLTALCQEAAMGPIREIPPSQLMTVRVESIRAISENDFVAAARNVRPSVSSKSLTAFQQWSDSFGSR